MGLHYLIIFAPKALETTTTLKCSRSQATIQLNLFPLSKKLTRMKSKLVLLNSMKKKRNAQIVLSWPSRSID